MKSCWPLPSGWSVRNLPTPCRSRKKKFPPTRRQKIESARERYSVKRFEFCRVDADNVFFFDGMYYRKDIGIKYKDVAKE